MKNINLIIDIDSKIEKLKIENDHNRIIQILVNLMNNSLKFTPKGG